MYEIECYVEKIALAIVDCVSIISLQIKGADGFRIERQSFGSGLSAMWNVLWKSSPKDGNEINDFRIINAENEFEIGEGYFKIVETAYLNRRKIRMVVNEIKSKERGVNYSVCKVLLL